MFKNLSVAQPGIHTNPKISAKEKLIQINEVEEIKQESPYGTFSKGSESLPILSPNFGQSVLKIPEFKS